MGDKLNNLKYDANLNFLSVVRGSLFFLAPPVRYNAYSTGLRGKNKKGTLHKKSLDTSKATDEVKGDSN